MSAEAIISLVRLWKNWIEQMNLLRTIPAECIKSLNAVCDEMYPMMQGFIPTMIKSGLYAVCDENGTRLPTEKAMELL